MAILVVLVASGAVLIHSSYQGRNARVDARQPPEPHGPVTFLWLSTSNRVGDLPATVFYVRPTSPDAPLPPGVAVWPKPGEAYVSRAWQEAASKAPANVDVGTVVGTIAPVGLATEDELVAYVNPPAASPVRRMLPVTGFGSDVGEGATDYDLPEPAFYLGYAVVVVPTILLAVAVVLLGNGARSRRESILRMLGASRWQLVQLQVVPVIVPILAGGAAAMIAVQLLSLRTVRLPGIGYPLMAADVVRARWPLVGVGVAAVAALVAASLWVRMTPRRSARSTRLVVGPVRWVLAAVCAIMLILGVPAFLYVTPLPSPPPGVGDPILIGSLLVAALTLPALVQVVPQPLVHALRKSGTVDGLIGAGLLRGSGTHVVRLVATIAAVLAALCLVSVYVYSFRLPEESSIAAHRAAAGQVAVIKQPNQAPKFTPAWLTAVAGPHRDVVVVRSNGTGSSMAAFSDADLGRPGPSGRCQWRPDAGPVRGALRWIGPDVDWRCPRPMADLQQTSPGSTTLIVRQHGGPIDVAALAHAMVQFGVPYPPVNVPGSGGLVGNSIQHDHARWVSAFAAVAAACVTITIWLHALADLESTRRRMLGFLAIGASGRTVWSALALRILLPVAIAVACGAVFAIQVVRAFARYGAWSRLAPQLTGFFVVIAAITVAVWLLTVAGSLRAWRSWRPGTERE